MQRLKQIIHEVHRRSLWQVLGIYLAGSWVALQVAQEVTLILGLPDWVPPLAIVLLVAGFPIVMATAYVEEGGPEASDAMPSVLDPEGHEVGRSHQRSSTEPDLARRVLTWRNALLGGVAAFSLVGVVTGGYMAMRALGIGPPGTLIAKGVIPPDATVLVADFGGEDRELAGAVTEALRVDVVRSPVVRLAERARVADALERMRLPQGVALDRETALELAVREGLPVVLTGDVAGAGAGYVLSAHLLSASDGAELASFRTTAEDASRVIPAIEELGGQMRARIGESLRSVRESPPLARVTTSSLEALKLFARAQRAMYRDGDGQRALSLHREAVRTDSTFAAAYMGLALVHYSNFTRGEEAVDALSKAYELRERLPRSERYWVEGFYHLWLTRDYPRAIEAGKKRLDLDPDNSRALVGLGEAYRPLREFERAEDLNLRAIEVDSLYLAPYINVALMRIHQGDFQGAQEILGQARRLGFDHSHPWITWNLARVVANQGDLRAAQRLHEQLRDRHPERPLLVELSSRMGAEYAAARGRLQEAVRALGESSATSAEQNAWGGYLRAAIRVAWIHLILRQDRAAALAAIDEALETRPLDSVDALDRPYLPLVELFARLGEPRRASGLLAEYEETRPAELGRGPEYDRARGLLAVAEGRFEEGLEALRTSDVGECTICPPLALAWAYDVMGVADSAVVQYRRFVDTPYPWKYEGSGRSEVFFGIAVPLALERLGDLYADRGETEEALRYYRRFVELWKDCDPELRPRVERAKKRMEALTTSQTAGR